MQLASHSYLKIFVQQNLAKMCRKYGKRKFASVWGAQHPNAGQNIQYNAIFIRP